MYGRFGIEFYTVYDTFEEYQEKTVSPDIFIHFINQKLSLTVHDIRAGVLVSHTNDKSVLKKIFVDSEIANKELINTNFYKDMVINIFEISEEEYNKNFINNLDEN